MGGGGGAVIGGVGLWLERGGAVVGNELILW